MVSGEINQSVVLLKLLTLSNRGTLGGCYATSLGAALHEIGHIFDLVHSDCGIMARGFNDLDLFFSFGNSQNCLPASIIILF